MTLEIVNYDEPLGTEKQYVVKLENLEKYVQTLSSGGGFKEQYGMLKPGLRKPCTVGRKPENKAKNRYIDLLPYDDTRVVLQKTKNDPHSDYINASYVDGYNKGTRYICAQGPLDTTVSDFWRMVWQEDVNIIVMTANIIESGQKKCEKYWPDKVLKCCDIIITFQKEMVFLDYTIRTYKLIKVGVSGHRIVRQYQYTTWPDHGVPPYPMALINMLKDIKKFQESQHKTTPCVFHCSAGVGRSGTLMVLDSAIAMSQAEGKVDVLGILYQMRQQRVDLIENMEQYAFVYKALVEYHFGDKTCKKANEMVLYFNKLRFLDPQLKKTGLELQFESLRKLETQHFYQKCLTAITPNNEKKNRDHYIIPPDDGRPVLKTSPPSNYINAVYTHHYGLSNHFVVTQYPFPDTLADFWQLVWDSGSSTIVVLNEISNKDTKLRNKEEERWSKVKEGFLIRDEDARDQKDDTAAKIQKRLQQQAYKKELEDQQNAKRVLFDVKQQIQEAEEAKDQLFNDAKQEMMLEHRRYMDEVERKKESHKREIATTLSDAAAVRRAKEAAALEKAVLQADARARDEDLLRQLERKEATEAFLKHYHQEMAAKERKKYQQRLEGYQERKRIDDNVERLDKEDKDKQGGRGHLEREAQHIQMHQIARKRGEAKQEQLENIKDYMNHMRSLDCEEDVFQKYAAMEIEKAEAKGMNTYAMKKAARPGIECGKGPLFKDRGHIRPRYYSAAGSKADDISRVERKQWDSNTKKKLGFML